MICKYGRLHNENVPGFSPYNGLQWGPNGPKETFSTNYKLVQRALNDSRR